MNWTSLRRTADLYSNSPPVLPITVAELKTHARIDGSDEDSYLEALILAATDFCENSTWLAFLTQTWQVTFDAFPSADEEILLPRPPLISVSSVGYIDSNGVSQTLAGSAYQVDTLSRPGRLRPARGTNWPSTRSDTQNTVTVTFVAGYGATAAVMPASLKHAVKFLATHWYEERQPAVIGNGIQVIDLPMGIQSLLKMHSMRGW